MNPDEGWAFDEAAFERSMESLVELIQREPTKARRACHRARGCIVEELHEPRIDLRQRGILVSRGFRPLARRHHVSIMGALTTLEVWVDAAGETIVEFVVDAWPDEKLNVDPRISTFLDDGRALTLGSELVESEEFGDPSHTNLPGSGDLDADLTRFANELKAMKGEGTKPLIICDADSLRLLFQLTGLHFRSEGSNRRELDEAIKLFYIPEFARAALIATVVSISAWVYEPQMPFWLPSVIFMVVSSPIFLLRIRSMKAKIRALERHAIKRKKG